MNKKYNVQGIDFINIKDNVYKVEVSEGAIGVTCKDGSIYAIDWNKIFIERGFEVDDLIVSDIVFDNGINVVLSNE